jgi:positive regulator of sigma E activity
MLRKTAVVIEKKDSKITLDIVRDKMCGCCSNLFCGAGKKNHLVLADQPGVELGDKVELLIKGSKVLLLSFICFLVPSLLFVGVIYILKDKAGNLTGFWIASFLLLMYFLMIKLFIFNRIKDKIGCEVKKIL